MAGGATTLGISIAIGAAVKASLFRATDTTRKASRQLGAAIRRTDRRAAHMTRRLDGMRDAHRRAGAGTEAATRRIRLMGLALDRVADRAARYRLQIRRAAAADARGDLGRMWGRAGAVVGTGYTASRLVGSALERDRAAVRLRTVLGSDEDCFHRQQTPRPTCLVGLRRSLARRTGLRGAVDCRSTLGSRSSGSDTAAVAMWPIPAITCAERLSAATAGSRRRPRRCRCLWFEL